MTIELARRRLVAKPWGARDLGQWGTGIDDGSRVGEIWYERSGGDAAASSLLLKLLFTTEQLSIQVHPDDEQAKALGLASGKTEAWYILHATPGAQVALGLKRSLSAQQLRQAAVDGSLAKLIEWRSVWLGDTVFVPAGTIHSLSAGLVIAEVQQRSDTTFRLLDPGRERDLHIDQAVEVARADLSLEQPRPRRLDDERTLLVSDPHFMLERLDLPGESERWLQAEQETWLLVVCGSGRAGAFEIGPGSALFVSTDRVALKAGAEGMVCIVAYTGGGRPAAQLLRDTVQSGSADQGQTAVPVLTASLTSTAKSAATRHVEDFR
ncbi:MAG: class I mannose-6-phosphate isomerase [Hyphomicrobiaceae bacterium]